MLFVDVKLYTTVVQTVKHTLIKNFATLPTWIWLGQLTARSSCCAREPPHRALHCVGARAVQRALPLFHRRSHCAARVSRKMHGIVYNECAKKKGKLH